MRNPPRVFPHGAPASSRLLSARHRHAGGMAALLCWVLALVWMPAGADWAGFSRYGEVAEIAVEAGEIRLNLRLAEKAVPEGAALDAAAAASTPPWLAVRLPRLLGKDGKELPGRLQSLDKIAADKANPAQEAHYEANLAYPVGGQMATLAILPPADASVSTGLVALHRGVPVSDLLPLQKPLTLALDWADPWRSRFDNPEFVRRHAEPRSYVYVEPYEVRHELLLRLKDFKPWLDLGLRDPRFIEDGEREPLKRALGAFLLGRNPLLIDGTPATPQLDRVEFVRFNRAGVLPVSEPGRLDADTVLVGVVLAYLTEAPARTVALRWDLFGGDAGARQISLMQGQETFDGYMSQKQPEFAWSQEESLEPAPAKEDPAPAAQSAETGAPPASRAVLPVGLLLVLGFVLFTVGLPRQQLVGAGLVLLLATADFASYSRPSAMPDGAGLDEAQAKALLQALLHNAYRAFQAHGEEQAYDRLAKSLGGDLLDDIYLQQRRAILGQAQGLGGEGIVDRIEVLESRVLPADPSSATWQVDSRWMAHGTVSHWGHSHERHNLYQARLTLRPVDGGQWRIVGMEFTGGQRLEAGASS